MKIDSLGRRFVLAITNRNRHYLTIWLLVSFYLAMLPAVVAAPRVWTDLQGRQVNAEFVRLVDSDVVLKQPNGRVARVPLATLSEADKEFIRLHLAEQGFRIWTATDGRQIEAQYLRVRDGSVYVKFQGSTISFPFDRLSISDRKFVREAAAKDDQTDQLPEVGDEETLPDSRLWSDRSGQTAIAQFDSILPDGRVLLATQQATRVVTIQELSDEDHDYLRNILEPKGLAHLVPVRPEPEPEPEPPPPEPPVEPEPPFAPPQGEPPVEPPVAQPAPLPPPPPPRVHKQPQNDRRDRPSDNSDLDFSMDPGVLQIVGFIAWLVTVGGNLWIAAIAFQRGSPVFGMLALICCCPAAVMFGLSNSDECAAPLGLMVLGFVGQVMVGFMMGMQT